MMSVYEINQEHHGHLELQKQKGREIVGGISVSRSAWPQREVKFFASNQQKSIYQLGGVERTLKKQLFRS